MTSMAESGLKIGRTIDFGRETFTAIDWKNLELSRVALAIASGSFLIFPEEMTRSGSKESLLKLRQITSALIALNEKTDLGSSARLKRNNYNKFYPLLELENFTNRNYEAKKDAFIGLYGQSEEKVNVFEKDFMLLSKSRGEFQPEEYKIFLELDSAIFEAVCIALVIPDVLSQAGVNFPGEFCNNIDELKLKYGLFLTENFEGIAHLNKYQRGILTLHAQAMAMKVRDDLNGVAVDKLLKIPNFSDYADCKIFDPKHKQEFLKGLMNNYQKLAIDLGFPRWGVRFSQLLFEVSSKFKNNRSANRQPPVDDWYKLKRLLEGEANSTTLRHSLFASGLLDLLFRE